MLKPLAEPMLLEPYRVLKVVRETADVFTLTMAAAGPSQGFAFAPGQFNMLYVFGVGEVPISISGDPDNPKILVHTVRGVGAVSRGICELKKGETVGVRGPYGVPWPVAQAPGKDVLVIAGGLGMAPLRPAVYHLLARRPEYGSLELIYGARTPEDLVFRRELERWRGRFDFRVHVTVDSAGKDWRGNVGVVPNLISRARFDPAHTIALICGPGVMMRFTVPELVNRGVKLENIYVSLERNMKCGLGLCGHCQLGPFFVCKDGPVFSYDRVRDWFLMREV